MIAHLDDQRVRRPQAAPTRPLRAVPGEAATRREVFVMPGELLVADEAVVARTILGSCVAVCVWDAHRRVGGLNHFQLPGHISRELRPLHFAGPAIEALLELVARHGGARGQLEARLYGGAALFGTPAGATPIGDKNVAAARQHLQKAGVPVAFEDVGGTQGRKLLYDLGSGRADVFRIARSTP